MRFFCYAPIHFEPWDFRSPDEHGIGGSETCVVETARRLAQRGHDVTVYAPLRDGCPPEDSGGAKWRHLDQADFSAPRHWILHRCPIVLDKFGPRSNDQPRWLVCQDVFYPPKAVDGLNDERLEKLDLAMPLCEAQERYLIEVSPALAGRTVRSSNGIRVDLIRQIEAGKEISRDPLKMVYSSSPDRGLPALLKIFKRAREWAPDLKLTVCYGWNNIDKCEGPHWRNVKKQCVELMDQPGVTWLGRLPHEQLYREFLSAGLWVYPTTFTETSCISCMEAQALGAIPITNPLWAMADNVRHGVFLHGDPGSDPLARARYVGEISRLSDPELQERIRPAMMSWARGKFSWERIVDQWEALAMGYAALPAMESYYAQYAFQLKHAKGKILNLGCNCDLPGFGARGAVNVDVHEIDPFTGAKNKVQLLHDIRYPIPLPVRRIFDTVILGDVLEHMTDADAKCSLVNAKECLRNDGQLIITCPNDDRGANDEREYAVGVSAAHRRHVTRDTMAGWIENAGLVAAQWQPIDYGDFLGWGVVAQ